MANFDIGKTVKYGAALAAIHIGAHMALFSMGYDPLIIVYQVTGVVFVGYIGVEWYRKTKAKE